MPSSGPFSLSVVDAISLEPMREYADAMKTWVESKPGDEFFVVVRCHQRRSTKCFIEVDGRDIGYSWVTHAPDTSPPLGPVKSGQESGPGAVDLVTHAFRFVAPASDDKPAFGKIEATWCACHRESDASPTIRGWPGDGGSTPQATSGSIPGNLPSVMGGHWEATEELASVSIHYTTELGLAVRGLVARNSDDAGRQSDSDDDVVEVPPPKRVKREAKCEHKVTTDARGVVVIEVD
jgi:hypothetical protein